MLKLHQTVARNLQLRFAEIYLAGTVVKLPATGDRETTLERNSGAGVSHRPVTTETG
jgi:hypothetical protein